VDLLEIASFLICAGHRDVFEYGYSFFKICCKTLKEMQKQQILTLAAGIGVALGGEKAYREITEEK